MNIIRQGDVLLQKCGQIPKSAKPVPSGGGRVILAQGEATGHSHALDAALADLFEEQDGTLYLQAGVGATLRHEEHGAIVLDPGLYRVVRQREYSPEAIRRVSD